ncbi:hypothetical protein KIPB_013306 [Kipferlia bialata]|uniref:Uncharacterized protein n=1 Tax=Kipferlia bialata TaxID=797122 RepID=A0A9K3GPJ9_9EUKA|nr:hypothetical protein KIPB_013306 [Kipferlia bialata]|eukprot:g13306.t1
MGTHGLYGFFIDGKLKVTISHHDGYPSGIGLQVVQFIQSCDSIEALKAKARGIRLVEDEDFDLSEKPEGDLEWLCQKGRMWDNSSVLTSKANSGINWAHVIDLDTCMFCVYTNIGNPSPLMPGRMVEVCKGLK